MLNDRLGLGEVGGPTGLPFDDVKAVLRHFPEADECVRSAALALLGHGSPGVALGGLADLAGWLASWKGSLRPGVEKIELALFVSRLGALAEMDGGDAYAFLTAVSSGAHLTSQLCHRQGVGLKVYDLALEVDAPDPRNEAALSEEDCAATMAFGMEATAGGLDVLALARAGEGGDVAALALLMLLMPGAAESVVPRYSPEAYAAASAMASCHAAARHDPFEALRRVGSRDMAAMAGAILAARAQRIPVILDGVGPLAAAAVLAKAGDGNLSHCLLGATADPTVRSLAAALQVADFVEMNGADGEGAGALLAVPVIRAAADALTVAGLMKDAAQG